MRPGARLLGTDDRALRGLLGDLLGEQGVELRDDGPVDVVLALVHGNDVAGVLAQAARFGVPVVALAGYVDDLLATSVRNAQVPYLHSLERPLAQLRQLVRRALGSTRPRRSGWMRRWRSR